MRMKTHRGPTLGLALSLTGIDGLGEGRRDRRSEAQSTTSRSFRARRIAFFPPGDPMGIDLTEGWAAVMKQQAPDRLVHEDRDPGIPISAPTPVLRRRLRR